MTNKYTKVPPHSTEAEQYVLGSIMLAPKYFKYKDVLCSDDFYRKEHSIIFNAIDSLLNRGECACVLCVSTALRKDGAIESSGGEIYLLNVGGCILNNSKHFFEICGLLHEIGTVRKNIERFGNSDKFVLNNPITNIKDEYKASFSRLKEICDNMSVERHPESSLEEGIILLTEMLKRIKSEKEKEKKVSKEKACFSCGQKIPVK